MALLTYQQQQNIKPIASNLQTKYPQWEIEAERYEFANLIGKSFYLEISKNAEEYVDLLNGCEFQSCGSTYKQEGLRYVLAYLTHARYIGESYVAETYTGLVQKNRPESERLNTNDIKRLQTESRELAFDAFELVRDYMVLQNYGTWKPGEAENKTTLKIKTIRK